MRRSIIRLIARRELRDLLRDRRTLFIVVVLPALLYPVFGLVGILFAVTMLDQKVIVGVSGLENLPQVKDHPAAFLAGGMLLAESDLDNLVIKPVAPVEGESALRSRHIDALLVVPPDFQEKLRKDEKPSVT